MQTYIKFFNYLKFWCSAFFMFWLNLFILAIVNIWKLYICCPLSQRLPNT